MYLIFHQNSLDVVYDIHFFFFLRKKYVFDFSYIIIKYNTNKVPTQFVFVLEANVNNLKNNIMDILYRVRYYEDLTYGITFFLFNIFNFLF